MDCSICYDAITAATGKVELSCSHSFHFSCLATWFASQNTNHLTQSCPCCRHESNENEKMPNTTVLATAMDEDDDDDESIYSAYERHPTEQERIDLAAAKERAAFLFARLKKYNSKEDLESYAASRIAALARGRWARYGVLLLKSWKAEQQIARDYIWRDKMRMRKATMMLNRHMEASRMSLRQWKNTQATIIQKGWLMNRAKRSNKHTVTITGDSMIVSITVSPV